MKKMCSPVSCSATNLFKIFKNIKNTFKFAQKKHVLRCKQSKNKKWLCLTALTFCRQKKIKFNGLF